MPESLGFSVYLNTFDQQWPILSRWSGKNAPVFLSLILPAESEELPRAEQICHKLANHGFRIIADVSRETCELFSEPDLVALAKRLKLWALRIDCGFAPEEIAAMAAISSGAKPQSIRRAHSFRRFARATRSGSENSSQVSLDTSAMIRKP